MNTLFNEMVIKATGATALKQTEVIQELWSGYGEIARYALSDSEQHSIVIKHICLPEHTSHPRGWNTDTSHERKVKSYKVESNWYQY